MVLRNLKQITMKAKVSMNLARLNVPAKIEKARQIVSAMTGNPLFTTPLPSLATVTAAATALETAFTNAQDGGKSKTAIMYDKEKLLDDLLSRLGHYVEDTSAGSASAILSAGMDVKNSSTPAGQLPAPTGVSAETGETEGNIVLRWDPVKNAAGYVVQINTPAEESVRPILVWTQIGLPTKAKFIAGGLSPGVKYTFRVSTIGSSGLSGWSDEAAARAV